METVEKLEEVKEKKANAKKNTAESKPKKTTKPNEDFSNKSFNEGPNLKEKRVKLIGGAFLLLFSTYLFVALISFIFTWSIDQDKIIDGYWALLSNNEIKVANWLGKTGAILSHWFMHRGFGIASLFFVPVIFALGFKLVFKIKLI
jgi:S-DNA-T family DNA segregation ATPase FtsK/SpoIIIE